MTHGESRFNYRKGSSAVEQVGGKCPARWEPHLNTRVAKFCIVEEPTSAARATGLHTGKPLSNVYLKWESSDVVTPVITREN